MKGCLDETAFFYLRKPRLLPKKKKEEGAGVIAPGVADSARKRAEPRRAKRRRGTAMPRAYERNTGRR